MKKSAKGFSLHISEERREEIIKKHGGLLKYKD